VPSLFWVLAIALACLIYFADKPFFIDDTLFVRAAEQIQKHPADFYGFKLNWIRTTQPMFEVFENPPLACYYIAFAATLFGWSEKALHLAFLLPALAAIWGIFSLARIFCGKPTLATIIAVFTPVFFVSASTIMCDVMFLAFWVWAIVLFEKGLSNGRKSAFLAAGCVAGLAYLTKFPGLALVPLLAAWGLLRQLASPVSGSERLAAPPLDILPPRRFIGWWIVAPLLPLLAAAGYEWLTYCLYGQAHLLQAAGYAHEQNTKLSLLERTILGAGFAGGCFLPTMFYLPWIWSRRALLVMLGLMAPALYIVPGVPSLAPLLCPKVGFDWGLSLQAALFLVAGAHLLWLALDECRIAIRPQASAQRLSTQDAPIKTSLFLRFWQCFRTPGGAFSLLLFFWIFGVFIFASGVNWVVNARSFLPMAPAVGILVARRIELRGMGKSRLSWPILVPAIPALFLSLLLTNADRNVARADRAAATDLCAKYQKPGRTIWFEGHWGFQYYMEKFGASPLDQVHPEVKFGDVVVVPNSAPSVSRPASSSKSSTTPRFSSRSRSAR